MTNTVRVAAVVAADILLGVLVAGPTVVQAAEPGFYVGANYAQVKSDTQHAPYDVQRDDIYAQIDFIPSAGSTTLDSKDAGYGIVGGYRFNAYWALEGGYLDLGNIKYRDRSTGVFGETGAAESWALNLDTKSSGLSVSALGIWPITYRTEIYARGGALFTTNKLTLFATNGVNQPLLGANSNSKVNFLAGLGVSVSFLEIYSLRLEYQRVFDVGQDLTGKADVDVYTLGVVVRF